MKKIALAAALAITFGVAHATVATFEGVDHHYPVPTGYADVAWTNFYTLDTSSSSYSRSGYRNAAVSGTEVAFNSSARPATISSLDSHGFSLADGWFTGAWNDGLQVTATATFENASVASKTFTVSTTGAVDEFFGWTNLASVTFTSAGGVAHPGMTGFGTHFAVDNLAFGVSAVPEPSSAALLLAGLAAIGLGTRRRRG